MDKKMYHFAACSIKITYNHGYTWITEISTMVTKSLLSVNFNLRRIMNTQSIHPLILTSTFSMNKTATKKAKRKKEKTKRKGIYCFAE